MDKILLGQWQGLTGAPPRLHHTPSLSLPALPDRLAPTPSDRQPALSPFSRLSPVAPLAFAPFLTKRQRLEALHLHFASLHGHVSDVQTLGEEQRHAARSMSSSGVLYPCIQILKTSTDVYLYVQLNFPDPLNYPGNPQHLCRHPGCCIRKSGSDTPTRCPESTMASPLHHTSC